MPKGIYCLEGFWQPKITVRSSVEPTLKMLEVNEGTKYFYHRCGTREEFEFFIKKWTQKAYQNKYPILYLAFHGLEEGLQINHRLTYNIDDLANLLEGKCERTLIFFASCKTLDSHKSVFTRFNKTTNALAVLGFRKEVHWYLSTAFELLVLQELSSDNFKIDSRGIIEFTQSLKENYAKLDRELEFRLVENPYWYSRKKKIA